MARFRWLAIAAMAMTGVLLVVGVTFVALAPSPISVNALVLGLAVAPLAGGLGVVIGARPGAPLVGALLALVALAVAAIVARDAGFGFLAARPDTAVSFAWLVAVLAEGAAWLLAAVALLLLHFPNGRVPSARWRWVAPALVVAAAITQAYGAVDVVAFRPPLEWLARPFGPPPFWLDAVGLVSFVALLLLTVASAVSLIVRYRTSDALGRARIKWLAVGGLGVALYPVVCGIEILAAGAPGVVSATVGIVGLVGIPVATAIAMLRHDLYDVDKALARGAAWILLTVVIAATYVAAVASMGVVLGQGSPVAAAIAAGLCALAVAPVRRRLEAVVDGRLYPRRRAALDALAGLYRDTSNGAAQPEALQSVLRSALRDDGMVVGYRVPGREQLADSAAAPVEATGGVPVELDGTAVGVLVPSPSGVASRELLREVAARAAPLVEVVRLRLELAGALRDVEASRARLVQIGYEERRRLERDLHDGAQQRLVSLGIAIRLAQRHLDDGTVDVPSLLEDTITQLSSAVAELRQLAQGIRPSSLDDGLEAALARLVQTVPMQIDADVATGDLPDEVATTAYFVVSEAVTNAVKHANASRIGLRVVLSDGRVLVRVSDDGRGGATLRPGSSLADRVAALGGSIAITSPIGRGTIVEAALPCAS